MFHKVLELGAGRADVVGHELKAQLQRERHAEEIKQTVPISCRQNQTLLLLSRLRVHARVLQPVLWDSCCAKQFICELPVHDVKDKATMPH